MFFERQSNVNCTNLFSHSICLVAYTRMQKSKAFYERVLALKRLLYGPWVSFLKHSWKRESRLASCKVASLSEHFNRHSLKCSVHHNIFQMASSLLAFSIVLYDGWMWRKEEQLFWINFQFPVDNCTEEIGLKQKELLLIKAVWRGRVARPCGEAV